MLEFAQIRVIYKPLNQVIRKFAPNLIRLVRVSPDRLHVHHLVVDWLGVAAGGGCILLKVAHARLNP